MKWVQGVEDAIDNNLYTCFALTVKKNDLNLYRFSGKYKNKLFINAYYPITT